jgi:response regulator RpfG family c-di-GMP phosphodiesterase/putative methionine-R-sulfoxide reductase with GAF domain
MSTPAKILIVDDEAAILTTTRHVLESAGYEVFSAMNGKQALDLACQHKPDLVLMDIKLPDLSGLDLCRQIKADPALSGTFIVMISGSFTDSDSQAEGLESGADGYIARPISNRELRARIQAMLRIRAAETSLRKREAENRLLYQNMTELFALHELIYDDSGHPVDYRILDCNPAFERITGIGRECAIGALASQVYGTGEPPFLDQYASVAETGIPARFESEFVPLKRWFSISVSSAEKGRFATISSDITSSRLATEKAQVLLGRSEKARRVLLSILEDRKQAENSLGENKARLDLALQSARMGVWNWNMIENKHFLDEQTCRILGIDQKSFTGTAKEFLAVVHPDDREIVESMLAQTAEQDVPYKVDFRILWPDKSLHYVTERGMLVRSVSGQPERINGLIWDITESKLAELELASQAEELARLYHASASLLNDSPFDLPALARTILQIVLDEFGQSNCSLFVVENDFNRLSRLAVEGPYADQVSKVSFTLDGPGLVPTAIRTGNCINTRDVRISSAYVPAWNMARSELTIPLKVGDRVIGAIDVQSALAGFFSSNDERLMMIFAERAALALEHARLYTQTERRLENLTSLRVIDTAIASSFDIKFTLGILLNQVARQLGIEDANIVIFNSAGQTVQTSVAHGFHPNRIGQSSLRLGENNARQVLRERRTINIDNVKDLPYETPGTADLARDGFTAYVGVPLIAKGLIKGVLELYQVGPIALDQDQWAFLDMLAGQAAIAIDSSQLFENLQGSNVELMMAYDETIEGWSQAMDLRDKDTEGHSRRVTELTVKLAASFGSTPEELIHIRRGALLHDIGKLGVPDEILRKPGALTDAEWEIMRHHPQLAYDMLAPITYLHPALDIPYCHHEKWDGSGYPRGLKGPQIPLAARIFAVVDVWDALTSDRPYRSAWSREAALVFIQEQSGSHFDPGVVDVFVQEVPDQR